MRAYSRSAAVASVDGNKAVCIEQVIKSHRYASLPMRRKKCDRREQEHLALMHQEVESAHIVE